MLEFLDNRYSAIITPRGNDNKYYPGYNFGLQPSYTIQTASNPSESDIITITLVEMSSQGSTAANDWQDEQSTETRWRWVKKVGETICYECIGLGRARYLVRQEVDYFGNPTGNYQVMEGYESQYPNFHVVATFTTQEIFETSECSDDETCQINTDIPTTIYFNAVTCNTYTLQTSCDWEIVDIPSNITVEPMTGHADSSYTVSICNTATPSSTALENDMSIKCCSKTKVVNFKTQLDAGCIKPQRQYINCLSQDVVFAYDGSCRIEITSIDPKLTYSIGNNTLTVRVPRNYGTSAITWSIIAVNCDCSSASTVAYINQDKTYERWVEEDGFVCVSGNSYHIERRYTGTTQDNITVRTDDTRTGSLIQSGDTRCSSSQTKWEWDGESYYCVDGNKFKVEYEYISYDGGINWIKTGNTRLGDMVEADSEWCNSAVTYSWVLTSRYECSGTTSYYLYQKYEQRGEQNPIPVYPNVFSIDGDGTQSLSKKMDNDPACGYVPPVTPIYGWVNMDISTDYYCNECPETTEFPSENIPRNGHYCKYYKQKRQVSYDGGNTYQDVVPYEYQQGDLYEEKSQSCGYIELRRWTNLDIDTDYICDSGCTCYEPIYQWNIDENDYVQYGAYTCFKEYYQVSTDNGETWENVYPIQTRNYENCENGCSCSVSGTASGDYGWKYSAMYKIREQNYMAHNLDGGTCFTDFSEGVLTRVPAQKSQIIGLYIFSGCLGLDSGSLTGCTNLKIITLPCSITHIDSNVFNCTNLSSIYLQTMDVPTLGTNAFDNTNDCKIYVYPNVVDKYKEAWPQYADRIKEITQ